MTPQLRFAEFTDEWQIVRLGNIAQFSKGTGISKDDITDDGETEAIRYGELYTTYSELIDTVKSRTNLPVKSLIFSQANDVIIPSSGESHIDIATASCVLRDGIALGSDLNIIRTPSDGVFLAYYLNNKKKIDIARLAQGVSVIHLYSSNLMELELALPTIREQRRISDFLAAVDDKISALEQKIEKLETYRRGVMQKIFARRIRFIRPDGSQYPEWEVEKFDDVIISLPSKQHQIQSSQYSDAGAYLVVDQGQKPVVGYSSQSEKLFSNTPVIVFGDHTTILKYIEQSFIVGADGTKLLKNKRGDNLKYLFYFLLHNNIEPEGYKRHFSSLRALSIEVPELEEQQKIAAFLSAIDQKITLTTQQLEKTKEFKKGLLQRMFV